MFTIDATASVRTEIVRTRTAITLADEAFGDREAAFLGDSKGDARHHALPLGQGVAEERAQALGAGEALPQLGDVGAAQLRRGHIGVLAGRHAGHELVDVARRGLRRGRHLGRHQEQPYHHHELHDGCKTCEEDEANERMQKL